METKENVGVIQHSQPVESAARNAFLLLSIDRCDRPAEILAGTRLYLDENQRVLIATDDVDLAAAASFEVAVENFVTVTPQEAASQFLPASAAPEMLRPG